MARARRIMGLILAPTLALVVALAAAPTHATVEVHVWLLVVLAIALATLARLVAAAHATGESPFDASLRPEPQPVNRPAALARLEREVTMAKRALDLHVRLRPVVTDLAAELLRSRRGIDLQQEPDRARAALGDDVWELVRPDRPLPSDRHAAGIDEPSLERMVVALERL
jgi:hypothetical protein